MDKTCEKCGQDIPGLGIEFTWERAFPDAPLEFFKGLPLDKSLAAARLFAEFLFRHATARYMDEFAAEYKRLRGR